MASNVSFDMSSDTGRPFTVVYRGSGTIVSPCPPKTIASTSVDGTFNSSAINVRILAESNTPAIPMIFDLGRPLTRSAICTMASNGLVTRIRIMFGERDTNSVTTDFTIFAFVANNSSRLIPGFRGMPDVITAIDDPAVAA